MRLRQGPNENARKDHAAMDLDINTIIQIVSPGIPNPKFTRLLYQECDPLFLFNSIQARFSEDDIKRMQSALQNSLYGISDITGSALRSIRDDIALRNPHQKPFDLAVSVADIADYSGTVVEASSANLVQIHGHRFSPDSETQKLITFITLKKLNPADLEVVLEIPGRGLDAAIKQAEAYVDRLSSAAGYSSRIGKPALNSSLQGAIQRSYTYGGSKKSVILTEELGPTNLPIVIESASGEKAKIFELNDPNVLPPETTEYCLRTSLTED